MLSSSFFRISDKDHVAALIWHVVWHVYAENALDNAIFLSRGAISSHNRVVEVVASRLVQLQRGALWMRL